MLLLLGVLIGTPGVAEPLFEQISARVSPTWQALETSFVPPHDQVEAWGRVRAAIAQLSTQAALPQPIFGYARWVPTVSRYSFQTARLAGPAPTGDPVVSVA